MHSSLRSRLLLVASILACVLGIVPSCSTSTDRGSDASTLTVALTDAASDEISSFVVDLTSVQLTGEHGAVTTVLASTLRIDMAALTDVSQVINVLGVPPALYGGVTVTLDLTNAVCILVGETVPATILDAAGIALTGPLTIPIEVLSTIPAIAGRHRLIELDFDLDSSMEVDAGANEVRLDPLIAVRLDPPDGKELVLVGELISVDESAAFFEAELQTFSGTRLSTIAAFVNPETVYQVNGVASVGPAGLSALSAAGAGTWLQWNGAIDGEKRRMDVSYVEAGIGTYNGGSAILEGHVVGRIGGAGNDATLTVLGTGENAEHTSFAFNTSFTVTTSFVDTKVLRLGSADGHDTDDLNIGQRVRVFGALTGTMMDADTASSVVRLQPARVLGFATGQPDAGTLTVDLSHVDLWTADRFTWSEGGPTPPDPEALRVAVGSLADGLGIDAGIAVEARGFFPAVDDAAEDFLAASLANHDLGPSLITVLDRTGGMTLTPEVDETGITLAITGSPGPGEVARLDKGFVGSTDLPTHPSPTVVPAEGAALYCIRDRDDGSTQVHSQYEAFASALLLELGGGAVIADLHARGQYAAGANQMTASLLSVVID